MQTKIKKGLECAEEMKELPFFQTENCKNNLIKLKNDLIERFKKNDRRKKAHKTIMSMKKISFIVRNLFNQMMMMTIIMKELNNCLMINNVLFI